MEGLLRLGVAAALKPLEAWHCAAFPGVAVHRMPSPFFTPSKGVGILGHWGICLDAMSRRRT